MVLFSTSLILLNNNKVLDSLQDIEDITRTINNNVYIILYITLLLLFTTIPAVLVAINCNSDEKMLYGLIGFLFSDIYLMQWSIKKFILKDPSYCKI